MLTDLRQSFSRDKSKQSMTIIRDFKTKQFQIWNKKLLKESWNWCL